MAGSSYVLMMKCDMGTFEYFIASASLILLFVYLQGSSAQHWALCVLVSV